MNGTHADILAGERPWHMVSPEEALMLLGAHESGLGQEEAARRLEAEGPNEIAIQGAASPWRIFLGQFKSVIIWVLVLAAAVSGVLGEAVDAVAILAIVVINAVMGFLQEYKAEQAMLALRRMAAPQARVLRRGRVSSIPASAVVRGDVLVLEAGDLIAADARVLSANMFSCVESALTGESEPVSKNAAALADETVALGDRRNMVFMGTSAATGTARAVVTATGMGTELGRIAGLIVSVKEDTPLQRKLDAFGRLLLWATLGIVGMLFGLGLLRGYAPFELFLGAVSLAVAAVPEGLPAVVTVALALGVSRMARSRALVRSLPAVEILGSTSVICTDKTGTLTAGQMTVRMLFVAGQVFEVTGEGYAPEGRVLAKGDEADSRGQRVLKELASVLLGCNNAHLEKRGDVWDVLGDPTEGALLSAGIKAGGDLEAMEERQPRLAEIPFDSERKLSTVIRRQQDGSARAYVNGAPDVLLQRCTRVLTLDGVRAMTDEDRARISSTNSDMAGQALRVLGSAWRDLDISGTGDGAWHGPEAREEVERDLTFVGLSGMYDPPRREAAEAVRKCRAAGIRVVMITGDHPRTAAAIARELGIGADGGSPGAPPVSGPELDGMDDGTLRQRVRDIAVFARVTAEHKLRIVRAWKDNGAVVAMTGDGVNDAPALHGADIGVAMGLSGTEVSRQAADMVITDDNFASIVTAVEEGRGVFDNIRKTLQYLLAGNSGELLLMAVCILVGLPVPLLPIHLLWINLVTDGLPLPQAAESPHHRRRVSHVHGFDRPAHGQRILRRVPPGAADGRAGNGPHLGLHGAGLRRTAAFPRGEEFQASAVAHGHARRQPRPGARADHFPAGFQPAQCRVRTVSELGAGKFRGMRRTFCSCRRAADRA